MSRASTFSSIFSTTSRSRVAASRIAKMTRSTATVRQRNETMMIGHMMYPPCLKSSIGVWPMRNANVRLVVVMIFSEVG